jgi:hypothetical protein
MWGLWQSSAEPWTPSNLTTYAWYDASDTNTITESAGAVSQWDDKSGNNRHVTQGTGSKQPTTGARTIGTLNVLDFDGGDILMNTSFAVSSLNISFAQVFKSDIISGSAGSFFGFGRATHTEGYIRNAGANLTIRGYGSRYPNQAELYFAQDTNPHFSAYVKNGTSSQLATQDGVVSSRTTTVTTFTSQRLALGGQPNDSGYGNGVIAETIFFSSAISEADRQKIEGYLAWKWGLQANLPSDHPYKNSAPTQ